MIFRRAFLALLSTILLLGLAWGCAAADDSGSASPENGGSNSLVDSGNEGSVIVTGAGRANSGQLGLNPLCIDPNADTNCVPDFPTSCADYTPPAAPSEDAGLGADAASGQAGANGAGGSAGDSAGPIDSSRAGDGGAAGYAGAAGDGGASGATGATGTSGAAGAAGASGGPPVEAPQYSCQVQRAPSPPHGAFSGCALAGPGGENAPCLTASDCQAGLGCVGDQNAGLCQKYCCQDANDCEHGTYCAERPMRDATTNALPKGSSNTLLIPVCVHAENCDLSTPYPCPKGSDCACKANTACLVVRSDGTTTCAVPGTGTAGEACPCAWGHVCSAATSQCLKLCYTRDSGTCGEGRCQSAAELPDGWGVCIGARPDGG